MKNLSRKKLIYIVVGIFAIFSIGAVGVRTAKYYPFLFELLFKKDISLKKADHNINVLLLGIGGGTHEGPDLTDTIIFASLNQAQNKITLVSIPRDFWVLDLNSKINTAYYYGETKSKGGGITLAKAVVSKILGQPISSTALM
ncbi:MAG: LCP family protein, partial [Patescibacteria group bacterium]|nr:LCP family protein [Patescibacteria group bacterium]